MRKERYLVGLDVGTSKVTAVVGEVQASGLDVVGLGDDFDCLPCRVARGFGLGLGLISVPLSHRLRSAYSSISRISLSGS